MTYRYTRRRLAALAIAVPTLRTARETSAAVPVTRQGTPTGGTPEAGACQHDTTTAATGTCQRGSVPVTLSIPAIGVDAPVEVLETVGGVMQQPSDEIHVAWYKESARLGEIGNIWLAGHLNWWTTPEAVFTDLATLREGDEVVLLDAEENAFGFAVEWVRMESNLEPPRDEVLGMTDHEAVTLITCAGEWDSSISEYNGRTVARAVRWHDIAAG